jgi:hypothetical protein
MEAVSPEDLRGGSRRDEPFFFHADFRLTILVPRPSPSEPEFDSTDRSDWTDPTNSGGTMPTEVSLGRPPKEGGCRGQDLLDPDSFGIDEILSPGFGEDHLAALRVVAGDQAGMVIEVAVSGIVFGPILDFFVSLVLPLYLGKGRSGSITA